jgi:hypothetical protein
MPNFWTFTPNPFFWAQQHFWAPLHQNLCHFSAHFSAVFFHSLGAGHDVITTRKLVFKLLSQDLPV